MRINRLSIFGKYKNIQTGVLVLSDNNYTALVGANGSGKSNWIEIMASIMQHLLDNIAPDFGYRLIMHDEKEVRSCSMDIGGITPLYVYRMWGGRVPLEEIEQGFTVLRKQGFMKG